MDNFEQPLFKYKGKVILVEEQSKVAEALDFLKDDDFLGFDLEKKPSFVRGQRAYPALLQFAGEQTTVLFRVCKFSITKELIQLIQSPNIKKVGVGVSGDCADLKMLKPGLCPQGFIELQEIAERRRFKTKGLKNLAAEVLGVRTTKSKAIATSNWTNNRLSQGQIEYGVKDAVLGRMLGWKLIKE